MREIDRVIVSGIIFSKDGKILLGKKDPKKGGVYSNVWHLPGGGLNENESLEDGLKREILEEVGLNISNSKIVKVDKVGEGISEKVLESGEKVLCNMKFNRFEVFVSEDADLIRIFPSSDLVELRWFSREELLFVEQIPGGLEFFKKMGYI